MKMECEMGTVLACQVDACSYNRNLECRAGQIEVGGCEHAKCDTFTTEQVEELETAKPMVAACDVAGCKFNENATMCLAPAISLGHHAEHAECDSFVPAL
ncbi:MAG: DUF1540 domain-containing protein [Actinobacteria bacterium]|nr:DUF1540 domain-containing protein [Actinomycetota bacterium]MCL5883676.1 DUF1540 domain-containing protein [Actinomycetota bacterium]